MSREMTSDRSMSSEVLYQSLDDNRKAMVDAFVRFLYQQQEDDGYRETVRTVQSALKGENIVGSYDTVEDMMEALNA